MVYLWTLSVPYYEQFATFNFQYLNIGYLLILVCPSVYVLSVTYLKKMISAFFRNVCPLVFNYTIHMNQELEITEISISERLNKENHTQTHIHTHMHQCYSVIKKRILPWKQMHLQDTLLKRYVRHEKEMIMWFHPHV